MPMNLGLGLGLSRRGGGSGLTLPSITAFTVGPQSGTDLPVSITLYEGLSPPTAIYIVGVNAGSGAPSATQIIAGQNSAGTAAPVATSIAVASTGVSNLSVTAPPPGDYDFYTVATDAGAATSNIASALAVEVLATYNPSTDLVGYRFSIDPSVIGTLFTDTAGTTPVTAPGDLVACARDPFNNAIVATQATSGNRPIYQVDAGGKAYLQMGDGVTPRWLEGPSFDFQTTTLNRVFVCYANQVDVGVLNSLFFALGAANRNIFIGHSGSANTVSAGSRTTTGSLVLTNANFGTTRPVKLVWTAYNSVPSNLLVFRQGGSQVAQNTAAQGGGTNQNGVLRIGADAAGVNPINGRFYGLIFAANGSADYTPTEAASAESYLDARLN